MGVIIREESNGNRELESSPIATSPKVCTEPSPYEPLDWRRAHDALLRLARTKGALDWEEGRWLLYALRSGAHVHLGHGSFAEYIERMLGYKPGFTSEKLRVAEALEELPQLTNTSRDGSLSWSAVRELARVATRETVAEWISCPAIHVAVDPSILHIKTRSVTCCGSK